MRNIILPFLFRPSMINSLNQLGFTLCAGKMRRFHKRLGFKRDATFLRAIPERFGCFILKRRTSQYLLISRLLNAKLKLYILENFRLSALGLAQLFWTLAHSFFEIRLSPKNREAITSHLFFCPTKTYTAKTVRYRFAVLKCVRIK